MNRLKTFGIYVLILVIFFIFSNILITIGLNSSYTNINSKGDIPKQVTIEKAQATSMNGRIFGTITNSTDDDISGKYLEIKFYSERDVFLGKSYIQINNLKGTNTQDIELYFKLQEVNYYTVNIVEEKMKDNTEKIEIIHDDVTRAAVLVGLILGIIDIPFIWFSV